EVHCVFAAAIDFGMAFLATEAFDFTDRHTLDAHVSEGILHLFQFERFNDCFAFLHSFVAWARRPRLFPTCRDWVVVRAQDDLCASPNCNDTNSRDPRCREYVGCNWEQICGTGL